MIDCKFSGLIPDKVGTLPDLKILSPESGSLSGSSVRSSNPSLGAPPPFRALVPLLGLPSATSYSAPTGEHPKLLTLEVLASALSRELTTLQRCLVLSLANILFWAGNPTGHSVLGREPLRLSPESGSLSGSSVRSSNPSLGAPPLPCPSSTVGSSFSHLLQCTNRGASEIGEFCFDYFFLIQLVDSNLIRALTLEVLASALSRELTTLQRCLVLREPHRSFCFGQGTPSTVSHQRSSWIWVSRARTAGRAEEAYGLIANEAQCARQVKTDRAEKPTEYLSSVGRDRPSQNSRSSRRGIWPHSKQGTMCLTSEG
ncbi:hypothetical protein ZIOFF_047800 [Zingiber officinale]|uniref:Uncharacterized protein n=1 Tax=Zingiber officinale TaxID=94328 RepID=A0A8J5FQ46_ZINOF|nr:hypothetical protein ZIOFF_047800 [Zingiber officinale]